MASVINTTIDNGRLSITVEGFDPLVIDRDAYPEHIGDYAALHGLKQKLGDAMAIERDPDTGRSATPAQKHAAMMRVHESLLAGEWNRRAEGDGTGTDGLLVRALVEFTGHPIEAVRATVAGWDKRTQAAMRGDENLVHIINRLRVARAPKGVDTGALLAGLHRQSF